MNLIARGVAGLTVFISALFAVYIGNMLITQNIMPLIADSWEKRILQAVIIIFYLIIILFPTIIVLTKDE